MFHVSCLKKDLGGLVHSYRYIGQVKKRLMLLEDKVVLQGGSDDRISDFLIH